MNSGDERVQGLIAEQAAEWVAAQAEGPLRAEQAHEFMLWLRQSPRHIAEYLVLSGVAETAADAATHDATPLATLLAARDTSAVVALHPSDDAAWPLSPAAYRRQAHGRAHAPRRRRHPVLRWAARVAVVLVVAAALVVARESWLRAGTSATYATAHGQQRTLHLADATVVQLDSDSAITVRYDRARRRVTLDRGQAYFEVATDAGRPFSVAVHGAVIHDIGTAFDVFRHADGATVTVDQGRVGVWHQRARAQDDEGWWRWARLRRPFAAAPVVELHAGEQVRITRAGQVGVPRAVNVAQSLAWRQGKVSFDNQTVAAVAAQFNRYNPEAISVLDPRIAELRISGTFEARNVHAFVAFLGSLPGVRVEQHGRQIDVRGARPARPRRR